MKKAIIKSTLLSLLAMFCAGLFVSSASLAAQPPTSLIVVRSSNDNLWKATCTGGVCSAFTQIPGQFSSQPAVTWDEALQSYVLIGTSSNGTMWRSSFSSSGAFHNNWTQLGGSSPSPVGLASRVLSDYYSNYDTSSFNLRTSASSFTPVNIGQLTLSPIYSAGYFQCTASAFVSFDRVNTDGSNVVWFGLSTVSGDLGTLWTAIDLPDGMPGGAAGAELTSIPITVTRSFNASSADTMTIYNVAQWGGTSTSDNIYIRSRTLQCDYHRW